MSNLVVVKCGGSLLSGPETFKAAASYVIDKSYGDNRVVLLVSAMSGLTNKFMDIYDRMTLHDLPHIENTYQMVLEGLPKQYRKRAMHMIKDCMRTLPIYLDARNRAAFVGAPEGHAAILGEYHILAQGRSAVHLSGPDAGFVLDERGLVDIETSKIALKKRVGKMLDDGKIPVVGGYLGRDRKTETYRLGARNCNDAFAAALAVALDACAVEIVKDVPGVFRAYPREDLGVLRNLSYSEAENMSWTGSPVVHSSAIAIAERGGLPIVVKDMKNGGTIISEKSETTSERFVAAMVAEKTSLVTIRNRAIGTYEGMECLPLAIKFEKDHENAITPISAMGGISYTLSVGDKKRPKDNGALLKAHVQELQSYLSANGFDSAVAGDEVGRITLVGDAMQCRQGTFNYLTGILSKIGVSLRSTVQIDERIIRPAISVVVDADKLETATAALTEELFAAR